MVVEVIEGVFAEAEGFVEKVTNPGLWAQRTGITAPDPRVFRPGKTRYEREHGVKANYESNKAERALVNKRNAGKRV